MKVIHSEVELAAAAVKDIEERRRSLVLGARESSFVHAAYDPALAANDAAMVAAKEQLAVAQANELAAGGPVYPA